MRKLTPDQQLYLQIYRTSDELSFVLDIYSFPIFGCHSVTTTAFIDSAVNNEAVQPIYEISVLQDFIAVLCTSPDIQLF